MSETQSQADPRERILDAAARLIGEDGWHQTSVDDIIAEAGVPAAEFYSFLAGKYTIPAALSQRMTGHMLMAADDWEAEDTTKDRLFDLFMARFDAGTAVKPCFERLVRAAPTDPMLATVLAGAAYVAMQRLLEAAGVSASGPLGSLRVQALVVGVYTPTLRDWFSDDTPDLGKTMSALDGRIDRLDRWARRAWSIMPGSGNNERSRVIGAVPPLRDLISEPLEDRPSRKLAGRDRDVVSPPPTPGRSSGEASARTASKTPATKAAEPSSRRPSSGKPSSGKKTSKPAKKAGTPAGGGTGKPRSKARTSQGQASGKPASAGGKLNKP